MNDNISGGEIVRNLRQKKGLTLLKLGELVDKHHYYLSDIEEDIERPDVELIEKIAKVLDYNGDLDFLITSFNKAPIEIKKILLEDTTSGMDLPNYYKKRKRF